MNKNDVISHFQKGYSVPEISKITDCDPETVYRFLDRKGLKHLNTVANRLTARHGHPLNGKRIARMRVHPHYDKELKLHARAGIFEYFTPIQLDSKNG